MDRFTVQTEHLLYTVSYKDSKGGLGHCYYSIYIGNRMQHMCNVGGLDEVLSEINFYESNVLGDKIDLYVEWDNEFEETTTTVKIRSKANG